MGQAQFDHADFLGAARKLVLEHGPDAVTVGSVTKRLKAPTGSFYHRFDSRDMLLGELWLKSILDFQRGVVAAIDAGDGLAAALHPSVWARANLDEACFLLLYHKDDFVRGEWPKVLKQRVAEQARQVQAYVKRFARDNFGTSGSAALRRASFILIDVPLAAIRPHLQRRESPPLLVDELIRATYHAVVHPKRTSKKATRTS